MSNLDLAIATFGGGCFWCTEAVFNELRGVSKVTSGYCGGAVEEPTYAAVCAGTTGHAEVIQIEFDPTLCAYEDLLEVFFRTHDPTTLNRQGNDVGTQYRSVVFYHDEEQKTVTEAIIQRLNETTAFRAPIVTEVTAAVTFYAAEDYHQDYFKLNPDQPYCRAVVQPKVEKFRAVFSEKLRVD